MGAVARIRRGVAIGHAELVMARAGSSLHADEYQRFYVARISTLIEQRMAGVHAGTRPKESLMVRGAATLLAALHRLGFSLTLVSGTPYPELIEEAATLEVRRFFGEEIHGPRDTADRVFTKRASIHELIGRHQIPGENLVAIGDGLPTDILGAARYGIDAVYVSHGIHAGEPVPDDFASSHGLGGWRPILTVEGLA